MCAVTAHHRPLTVDRWLQMRLHVSSALRSRPATIVHGSGAVQSPARLPCHDHGRICQALGACWLDAILRCFFSTHVARLQGWLMQDPRMHYTVFEKSRRLIDC
jgi:hypothetical protein